ncbi:hypothetical protein [Aurantiacibacter gilvus]|uniref:Uncharacterized protein n=1 Tax=Aurantiacibacter gilvus TaxID=3139141 RepID=A0ABU9IC77_9SPHN
MSKLFVRSTVAAAALVAMAGQALAADILLEERIARQEESRILTSPIAGIQNRFWFDYLGNVVEAQEELASDLNRASDLEDLRDAWEEYAHELRDEREDYIEEMAERGYRHFTITVD